MSMSFPASPCRVGSYEEQPGKKKQKRTSAVAKAIISERDLTIVFGIIDTRQSSFYNELIAVATHNTFFEMACIICGSYLARVREIEGDNGVNDHLWHFEKGRLSSRTSVKWSKQKVVSNKDYDEGDSESLSPDTTIASMRNEEGNLYRFTYDYGSTSTVLLKILAIGDVEGQLNDYPKIYKLDTGNPDAITEIQRKILHGPLTAHKLELNERGFNFGARFADRHDELNQLPAFHLPKKQQLDSIFPFFSEVITLNRL